MKKLVFAACATIFLASCGGGGEQPKEPAAEPVPEVKADDPSSNPDYKAGLALVAKNDCLTCHAVKEKITGPAYVEVAAKYAGAADTTITRLAQTIIQGGKGHWGEVPMTPPPTVTEDDAKAMVKYILLLKE